MAKSTTFDVGRFRIFRFTSGFSSAFAFRFTANFRHQSLDKTDEIYQLDCDLFYYAGGLSQLFERI
jgi:hypothetical protein